ncbi:MAG: hypothetical protein QM779_11840 [Propionicimonas sp.]
MSFMCLHALDARNKAGDEPGLYFGGHALLVLQLTGKSPGEPGYEAGRRKVERALNELRNAGAVRLVCSANHGRKARYRILADDLLTTSDSPCQ